MHVNRIRLPLLALLLLASSGCSPDRRTAAAAAEAAITVDSIRPIEVELARFRESVGGREVRALRGGAPSRDELVARFSQGLAAHDTAALSALLLDAQEFAWLYYPYTVYTHPPYQQAPGMVWLLTVQNSEKGLRRALERFGGREPDGTRYSCATTEPQDLNVLHGDCAVRLAGDTTDRRLFGTIIERAGHFKFVSYANGL